MLSKTGLLVEWSTIFARTLDTVGTQIERCVPSLLQDYNMRYFSLCLSNVKKIVEKEYSVKTLVKEVLAITQHMKIHDPLFKKLLQNTKSEYDIIKDKSPIPLTSLKKLAVDTKALRNTLDKLEDQHSKHNLRKILTSIQEPIRTLHLWHSRNNVKKTIKNKK